MNNNGRQYYRILGTDYNLHRMLVMKDAIIYGIVAAVLVRLCDSSDKLSVTKMLQQVAL